ncbi:MAG: hypothetical protein IJ064_01360 [Bacteroidaceae bacterium]|nr:hypothetical protein [Bacteroidaceae bacterium]
MKKTYIQPLTETYNLNLAGNVMQVLTGSTPSGDRVLGSGGSTEGNVTDVDAKGDSGWDIW